MWIDEMISSGDGGWRLNPAAATSLRRTTYDKDMPFSPISIPRRSQSRQLESNIVWQTHKAGSSSFVFHVREHTTLRRRVSRQARSCVTGQAGSTYILAGPILVNDIILHIGATENVWKAGDWKKRKLQGWTRCSRRWQTSPPVPPPCEPDETYASSLILPIRSDMWKHDVIRKTGSI